MAKKRTLSDLIKDEVQQHSLFNVDAYSSGYSPDWAVESQCEANYKLAAPEQLFVLEQPPTTPAPEQKHWVEIYTGSKRKGYYYYRYVWMEGRKLHHVHIGGNALGIKANATREQVEEAISYGSSPLEIIALIQDSKQQQ